MFNETRVILVLATEPDENTVWPRYGASVPMLSDEELDERRREAERKEKLGE